MEDKKDIVSDGNNNHVRESKKPIAPIVMKNSTMKRRAKILKARKEGKEEERSQGATKVEGQEATKVKAELKTDVNEKSKKKRSVKRIGRIIWASVGLSSILLGVVVVNSVFMVMLWKSQSQLSPHKLTNC